MQHTSMSHVRAIAASALMAAAAGMPPLGQQVQLVTRPGSGVVRERDKPRGFWGRKHVHTPRVLTPEARAKHDAKMRRRYVRWFNSILDNPCLSDEQAAKLIYGRRS